MRCSATRRRAANAGRRRGERPPGAAPVSRAARLDRERSRRPHRVHTAGSARHAREARRETSEARQPRRRRRLSTPLVTGRYRIERPLGHGAMSTVDLALDTQLDREIALKRLAENLSRDDELRARFQREARLAAKLAHPNVVRIYDVGMDDEGRPFIAMEYVDGETLAELVARRGPLPPREGAELGIQACRALAAAHEAGLVHRDVKPQNLLLRSDGVLKLGDFGVAVGLEGTRLTMAGTV